MDAERSAGGGNFTELRPERLALFERPAVPDRQVDKEDRAPREVAFLARIPRAW